ncbi:family 78 glycoside hydrolase catalytic domain [Paenarthrobacter nicotinovorans]|uniref:alpha-L-rhamnosidase n=1 Tax=Paenarthrobacter nicotinovorans TaxID=29320 RepID=A0ABV0GXH0_PAENI|nr:family 78 glycoside hydrolase catalytic domain [Paenarthrobacter nicotinovorans]
MTTWHARMIAADKEHDGAPLFRGEFELAEGHGDVESATLFLSALGVVDAWVNGQRASQDLLTPGWSSYEWRVRYSELDVTALISTTTVIGLALGNGWYRGRLAWSGGSKYYGQELGAFAELRVRFADGHQQVIGTDGSWTAGPSATTANDLYDGQSIDARRFDDAWLAPGFSSGQWTPVRILDDNLSRLEPYIGPPVRRQMELQPTKVWTSPAGKVLVDFGQNLVGWVRASVTGTAGDVVTVRHAEVLEHDELGTRPLRSAEATDRFTLSGGTDVFEPTLTFHGFRYVEVQGWPGGVDALLDGGLTAVVISSDMKRIGTFQTSNPLLNRLHENAVWGMRGNFVDVPTDCPQRDERLGWTGDLSAFAPSAAFLFNSRDFLRDWLRDLALEQSHDEDLVPFVVPNVLKYIEQPAEFGAPDTAAVWSDAAVWVPWALWEAYGDRRVLEEQFASMTGHARRLRSKLSPNGLWDTGFQFGDWLDPDASPDQPWAAKADKHVVATLCAYRTASLVAEAAKVLGDKGAMAEFEAMAADLRTAFKAHYVSAEGVITSDCTTVYALAIVFGILGEPDRRFSGGRLAELVEKSGFRISTGFAGTPFVTDALTVTGHLDAAYRLLLQTENPSWLYSVTMGATTIWERWDSMLPDGSINPGEMTSFNHYALGAVVDWMHRTIGGLSPLDPGYSRILIAPQPGGGLTWAETTLETPHGIASVRWDLVDGRLEVSATIPEGTEAVLRLPGEDDHTVGPGRHTISAHPAELTFQ